MNLANARGYAIKAQSETEYGIYLYGTVGWSFDSSSFANAVSDIPDDTEIINLYIHSYGGYVDDGYAILTNIDRLREDYTVHSYIDGVAYSMASAIAVSADRVFISPVGKLMVHNPWMSLDIWGQYDYDDLEELQDRIEDLKENLDRDTSILASIYDRKLGLGVEDVKDEYLSGGDHYFGAEEAVEAGLVDEITEIDFAEDEDELSFNNLEEKAETRIHSLNGNPRIASFGGEDKGLSSGLIKQRFGKNDENRDNNSERNPQNNKNPMSKEKITKIVNLSPDASYEAIAKEVSRIKTEKEQAESDLNDIKEIKSSLEKENSELKSTVEEQEINALVDEVIAKVESENEGKEVNANIREELETRAKRVVKTDDDSLKADLREVMKFKAESNLVPIGKDEDIGDDGNSSRSKETTEDVDRDELEQAKKEGEKARAEREKKAPKVQ